MFGIGSSKLLYEEDRVTFIKLSLKIGRRFWLETASKEKESFLAAHTVLWLDMDGYQTTLTKSWFELECSHYINYSFHTKSLHTLRCNNKQNFGTFQNHTTVIVWLNIPFQVISGKMSVKLKSRQRAVD